MNYESTKSKGSWGHMATSGNPTIGYMDRPAGIPESLASHPAYRALFGRQDRRTGVLLESRALPGSVSRPMVSGDRLAAGKTVHHDHQDTPRGVDNGGEFQPVPNAERRETSQLADWSTFGHVAKGDRWKIIRTQLVRPGAAAYQPRARERYNGAVKLPGRHRITLCIYRTPGGDLWHMADRTETQTVPRPRPGAIRTIRTQRRNRL